MSLTKQQEHELLDKALAGAVPYVTASFNMEQQVYIIAAQHPILLEPVGVRLTPIEALAFAEMVLHTLRVVTIAAAQRRRGANDS